MKIKISKVMKVKTSYSSQRETVVTSSFRACSLAMDDGGRCLLDVINDPKLLQSFLESGSDDNSKDPQDGTSSESAVESPQVSNSQVSLANHHPTADHIIEASDQMGYSFAVDGPALLAQSGVGSTAAGLGGMPLVVASSTGPQTYQHASSSGATIHHLPSTVTHVNLHPHSPASARSVTPSHNIKSPSMGPSSVHSMPPPSPLQQTRSPLPSHTPSPAPAWSPVPPVLSPAAPRSQSMPSMSVAFQQTHNQMLQTTCNIAQYVTALTSPQSVQKLTLQQQQQQQQQVFLQQQLPPVSQHQSIPRLTAVQTPVVTTVAVPAPMLHLIQAQASNVTVPTTTRTSHNNVRPIQPKIPNIRPKPPACSASNQFVSPAPAPKQTSSTSVTTGQRTVGVGLQPGGTPLVLNQGVSPGVFPGAAPGTILVNQIIPQQSGGQILISHGNLPSLLLRPTNPSPGQTLNATNSSNNATLITALQNQPQLFAPAKQTIHSPQTIVIPNNNLHPGLTSQNLNLTTAAIPNSGILSASSQAQNFLSRPNFIFSSSRLIGNQSLQLQQIQTANGPILALAPAPGQTISLPQLQALSNAQLAPVTAVPMQTVMTSQGVLSLQSHAPQSALQQQQQSLFGTPVPFTNHLEQSSPQVMQVPQPLTPNQVQTNHPSHLQQQNQPQQVEHSPKPASPQKPAKAPQLNLEELLKEHGIVPDSPVPSPECNSPIIEEPVPQTIVNSPQLITTLQPSQQVVLEQSPGTAALPHLKLTQDCNLKLCNLAIAQDGSVILHPQSTPNHNPTIQHFVSSGHIQGRTVNTTVNSMIFPTAVVSSAASVPVSTESALRNHSTLIARLNAAPALSVPDVTSLALSAVTGTTTLSTSNTTTLVPLVQSLSVTNTPISSSYIVQRTNVLSSAGDRVFVAEDVHTTQSHVTPVISSSSSTQNVQNRINHSGPFQTIIVPNEHTVRTMPQLPPKTVQSSHVGTVSTTTSPNVQPVVQKVGHKETKVTEVDGGAVVPSHNHPVTSSNVPNLLSKVLKELNELTAVRIRSPDQQKILQQLTAARQKLLSMQNNKSIGNRAKQNQFQKFENEIEKIIQRAQASHSIRSVSPQQLQLKPPVLNVQQSGQLEKQQNSKSLNSHNLQLVNLLKQNPPHSAPPKHTTHVTTTTVTAACDSTTTTVESSVSVHQKSNQVIAPAQPKLPNSHHHQSTKTSSEVAQQQVIVRLQKPPVQQQYIVQSSSNIVQRKAPSPAKRIVNTVLINEQLKKDQNNAVNPDVNAPFLSNADACRRLLSYHVYNSREPSEQQLEEEDRAFGLKSENLMRKMQSLFGKLFAVQSKNSSHPKSETPSHEAVQIQRLLIEEEQEAFDTEKSTVAEGGTITIPPARQAWLERIRCPPSPVKKEVCEEANEQERVSSPPSSEHDNFSEMVAEQERVQHSPSPVHSFSEKGRCAYDQDDHDCLCREASDHPEDSDPLFKEDDNLEAPVIDSCEDIVVPPNDNVERSPPTLKRIVIKPSRRNESDSDDQSPVRKRVKFNNSAVSSLTSSQKYNTAKPELSDYNPIHRPEVTKQSDFVLNKTNHKVPPMSGPFQSDNRLGDMVTELRKEFNMSPMEMDEDTRVSSHMVDFDPPGGVNHLVDFEPPVPRTEESSCDSNLLYNNSVRNNCTDKYSFLNDWQEYVQQVHQPSESDLAVSSILTNQDNPDLDLSGLDGLEDHLNDSQHCIPNGIQDVETENEMDYIGYSIPKHQKRFQDSSMQPASNCSGTGDQVQCAIRSITEADSRYDRVHTHTDFMSLNRHSQNAHIGGYSSSTSSGIGSTSRRRQHDVDEAVNSILM